MQAKARTVAFQGVDVLPADVQVLIAPGMSPSPWWGWPTRRWARSRARARHLAGDGSGAAAPEGHRHPRRPISPRRAATTTRPLPGLLAAMGVIEAGSPRRLRRARTGTRRDLEPGARRTAGGDCRSGGRARRDLPRRVWGRSGVGAAGEADLREGLDTDSTDQPPIIAAPAARPDQPSARQAGLSPPEALMADDRALYPDLAEIKGQERRQACARSGAAGGYNLLMIGPVRANRCWQRACPGCCRRWNQRKRWKPRWCVPWPALSVKAGSVAVALFAIRTIRRPCRHWSVKASAKLVAKSARASWRPVPRRAAGSSAVPPGGAAPAARNRPRDGDARRCPRDLSGALPARGSDEPLSLRPLDGSRRGPAAGLRVAAPTTRASFRGAAARSHRSRDRRKPGRRCCGPCLAAASRKFGRYRCPRGRRARRAARPPCRTRSQGQAGCRRSRPRRGPVQRAARNWSKPRCNADTDGRLATIAEPDAEGRVPLSRAAERLGLPLVPGIALSRSRAPWPTSTAPMPCAACTSPRR